MQGSQQTTRQNGQHITAVQTCEENRQKLLYRGPKSATLDVIFQTPYLPGVGDCHVQFWAFHTCSILLQYMHADACIKISIYMYS